MLVTSPLDQIRVWLSQGFSIKATDLNKPILEQLDNQVCDGNITIYMDSKGENNDQRQCTY